jgi:hypothetical protein
MQRFVLKGAGCCCTQNASETWYVPKHTAPCDSMCNNRPAVPKGGVVLLAWSCAV